jgi:hypothetical protein
MRFEVTQFISDFVRVDEQYKTVEVKNKFVVNNDDNLISLLLTLIDFGDGKLKFEVEKEEVTE